MEGGIFMIDGFVSLFYFYVLVGLLAFNLFYTLLDFMWLCPVCCFSQQTFYI